MDGTIIPESNSIKVLGFKFDSLLTWEPQIIDILGRARQRAGQLYCCRSFLAKQDISTIYKSWIRPTLEYGNILYSGAASTHLRRLDDLQSRIEQSCSFCFSTTLPSSKSCNYGIGLPSVSWRGSWELTDLLPTVLWQSDSSSVSSSSLLGPC